ncbi:MAG TPA: SIMPL domain-containing protein [Candidatus Cybelea sp.]
MKRTFLCLLGAFAFATVAASAAPAATEITAGGTGSVSMPPDVATVTAAVETNAANADDAISRNNATYNRVVAALEKSGVARGDIALVYYNVSYNPPPQVMPPNSTGDRYGYTVSRSFAVKVRQIGNAGRVSDACMSSGATAINGVSFGLADPTAAREQATAKAVAAARANADAIARAATLRIVGIKSIELTGEPSGPVPLMRAAAMPAAPTQFDQSNVSVTVSVSVVFIAEP